MKTKSSHKIYFDQFRPIPHESVIHHDIVIFHLQYEKLIDVVQVSTCMAYLTQLAPPLLCSNVILSFIFNLPLNPK
jgi:hypothetical protein